jgi:hypothetical protein
MLATTQTISSASTAIRSVFGAGSKRRRNATINATSNCAAQKEMGMRKCKLLENSDVELIVSHPSVLYAYANADASQCHVQQSKGINCVLLVPLVLVHILQRSSYGSVGHSQYLANLEVKRQHTIPAYFPSFVTQTYLSPSFTKHSYTRSIGEWMSSVSGA